jgi:hypothetical protein
MKRLAVSFLLLLFVFTGELYAGEVRMIELNDGSLLYGKIVSLKDGVYTINTMSLGSIKIEESKIRVIRFKSDDQAAKEQIQAMQKLMLSDKEIVNVIASLKDDPDVQKILKDPNLMKAINSGDLETLVSNPKFLKLLSNPKILNIKEKVMK